MALRDQDFRPGNVAFYAAALVALFLAYAAILRITLAPAPVALILTAMANVVPIALLGLVTRALLLRFVFKRRPATQAAIHLGLALVYTMLLFWLVMVFIGAVAGQDAVEFSVRPFRAPAAAWQLYQGLFIYAMTALAVHAEAASRRTATVTNPPAPTPQHLLVREDDELRPIQIERIVLVRGADDYCEAVTVVGTFLIRATLTALADRLGDRFVRVHRSYLISLDRIVRVEPAGGGRMLVHMATGEVVRTSRAGSRLLRERVI